MSGNSMIDRSELSSENAGKAAAVEDVHFPPTAVGNDKSLLQRAYTQWQFGDWENLARLSSDSLMANPDRAPLAVLAAAGCLQLNRLDEAKRLVRVAEEWGASHRSICEILVAGVHNSLGRAAAIDNQPNRALAHFERAIESGASGGDFKLLAKARAAEQLGQLGLPLSKRYRDGAKSVPVAKAIVEPALSVWIQEALEDIPDAPPLLIAAAEVAQRNGDLEKAIGYWQRLAAVEGPSMAQAYYERLALAYQQIKSFPLGTPEEEALRAGEDKYEVLKRIHEVVQPGNYLEIGVQTGRSLLLAGCPAIGIDPAPMMEVPSATHIQLVRSTSDQFFAENALNSIRKPIEMAFIDGMHLFEYALRDFINIEMYASSHTLVVMDDIFPGSPAQAARDRRTRAWTGDVWKLIPILRRYRPDLSLLLLDVFPTGLLCISGLNPRNTTLQEAYADIVVNWSGDVPVPEEILSRIGSMQSTDPEFEALLKRSHDRCSEARNRNQGHA